MTARAPVVLFGLLFFLIATDQFCILPLLHVIGRDLHLSTLELCLLVTAYHGFAGAFGLFVGPMIDRRRHGGVFLIGLVLFLGASVLTTVAQSLAVLLTVRALAGLGTSGVGVGVSSFISTLVPPAQRRVVNGRVMVGALLGLVLGPLACGAIALKQDWRWIYAFLAAVTLPTVPIVAALVRNLPLPAYRRRLVLARGYASLMVRLETGSGILVMFLFTGAIGGIMAILGLWLFRFPDVDVFDVTKVFAAGGLGLYAGGNLSQGLAHLIGRKRLVVLSSLLLLLCFFFLFCIDEWVGLVYTAFFFTALVESVRRGPLQGTLVAMVKTREMPTYTLLKNGAGHVGTAVMVPIMGILLEAGGNIEMPILLAVALTISATLAYFFFVRPPVHEPDRT
ncbi:MAG: MFS transporter [Planctomycetes bacterium]|nr:MFS transporter [Planctomycetota bacterium]